MNPAKKKPGRKAGQKPGAKTRKSTSPASDKPLPATRKHSSTAEFTEPTSGVAKSATGHSERPSAQGDDVRLEGAYVPGGRKRDAQGNPTEPGVW